MCSNQLHYFNFLIVRIIGCVSKSPIYLVVLVVYEGSLRDINRGATCQNAILSNPGC